MAGVQSTTTGWRLTALTCTQWDGVRKQGTRCNIQMVRNTIWPQQFGSNICFMLKYEDLLNFSLLEVGGIYQLAVALQSFA